MTLVKMINADGDAFHRRGRGGHEGIAKIARIAGSAKIARNSVEVDYFNTVFECACLVARFFGSVG